MAEMTNDIEKTKLTITLGNEELKEQPVESKLEAPVNEEPAAEPQARQSLEELIREQATDEDMSLSASNMSLRKILGGDILMAEVVRRQVWLFLLITLFLIVYIAQRYSYDKYLTEIATLTTELEDAKNKALATTSELTENTRESKIIDLLKASNDSLLKIPDRPPYIVPVE